MKTKVFKYLGIKILIIFLGVVMFLMAGVATYDAISKFEDDSPIAYFDLIFTGSIFLLNLLSLVLVIFKSSKCILFLNIYYIFFLSAFVIGVIDNYIYNERTESSYVFINFSTIILLSLLIFAINRFRYKEINYENMEEIGKLE
ncbi:MAG: polysaccharide biosynthesis protein [Chryseobacterium sp.]|jgi:hypothetical protein|nr:polysaccharide biosynthesis protein [Chryseobacterium sp.]